MTDFATGSNGGHHGDLDQLRMFEPPPNGHEFNDPGLLKEFCESGNAIITLFSQKTTRHFSFKIKEKRTGVFFVSTLMTTGWEYIGSVVDEAFSFTRATPRANIGTPHYEAFKWFWGNLVRGKMQPKLVVYHEGKCGACGRPLTDPVSIKLGLGPECRQKKFKRPAVSDKV